MTDKNTQNQFDIPKFVQENYADLIPLILETKSMDDKERQYWFHILPVMSQVQVTKLRNILLREKEKIAAIDKEYSEKLSDMQTKRINHWETESYKKKLATVKENEKSADEQEKEAEANLLKELDNI